jgi:predicted secreted hydrolase
MSTNLIDTVGETAASVLDGLAEVVLGPASSLRDGTEHAGVELPRDLYAHASAQTEWWYYTGHLQTDAGRRLGFELVFFKRRTDLDRFGVVPLRLIGNPLYLAHFALTDESRGLYQYEHRKSANGLFDPAALARGGVLCSSYNHVVFNNPGRAEARVSARRRKRRRLRELLG